MYTTGLQTKVAFFSVITDWVFNILPIFFVLKLNMGRREKMSVIAILATGAL